MPRQYTWNEVVDLEVTYRDDPHVLEMLDNMKYYQNLSPTPFPTVEMVDDE